MGSFVSPVLAVAGMIHSSQQAKAQRSAQQADVQSRVNQIRHTQAIEEKRRREKLRQAMAQQRARFGGQGLSATGGSAKAVLAGLKNRTESEIADARSYGNLQIGQINRGLAGRRRLSLLQESQDHARNAFDLFRKGARAISLLGG